MLRDIHLVYRSRSGVIPKINSGEFCPDLQGSFLFIEQVTVLIQTRPPLRALHSTLSLPLTGSPLYVITPPYTPSALHNKPLKAVIFYFMTWLLYDCDR